MTGTLWRLRPSVQACPVEGGIHLRGWAQSLTVEGGAELWRLWQLLAARLAPGCREEQLERLSSRPGLAAALHTLVELLRAHDLLVRVPESWFTGAAADPPAAVAGWLAAVAPDPLGAWRRIATAAVTASGNPAVVAAAVSALTASGIQVQSSTEGGGRGSLAMLATADGRHVVAGTGESVGFVTPVGPSEQVHRDAEAIAQRLAVPPGLTHRPGPLAVLVGAAAAHRLLDVVAGLPPPAAVGTAAAGTNGSSRPSLPTVLVARPSPLQSTFHPWLSGEVSPPAPESGRVDLATALDRVAALCDLELGALPAAETDDLPQIPLGLARCRLDRDRSGRPRTVAGHGSTPDLARLAAVLAAAEHLTEAPGRPGAVACGVDRMHAEGVLLRRLMHRWLVEGERVGPSTPTPACLEWETDPVAARWWRTLTVRFGASVRLDLSELDVDLYHARVWSDTDLLGWAIEATPGDAVAFATQAAVAAFQWPADDPGTRTAGPCGAFPVPQVDRERVPWYDGGWAWPDRAAEREPELQLALRRLLGQPASALVGRAPWDAVTRALANVGFVLLEVRDRSR